MPNTDRPEPFTAETAYIIAAICLFCTGHWIGGLACIAACIVSQKKFHEQRRRNGQPSASPADSSEHPTQS